MAAVDETGFGFGTIELTCSAGEYKDGSACCKNNIIFYESSFEIKLILMLIKRKNVALTRTLLSQYSCPGMLVHSPTPV